jgi:16S rRNA (adenine1518-N6/adenine1519-N6)-dimethyltransferase
MKKALGQHFLNSPSIISKIIKKTGIERANVLEIGPGAGALTKSILEQHPKFLLLIEKDESLQEKLSSFTTQTTLIFGDATKDLVYEKALKLSDSYTVISNLPYNVSSLILIQLLKRWRHWPECTLMFQKEVAERVLAKTKTKKFSSLSVLTQNFYEVEKLVLVPPGAFHPPPEVQSLVVHLKRRDEPLIEVQGSKDFKTLESFCRTLFAMRRKTLKNVLGKQEGASRASFLFKESQVSPQKRAEQLEFDEIKRLYLVWKKGLDEGGDF